LILNVASWVKEGTNMSTVNDELKKAISDIQPSFVATADKNGYPNVSPKGSLSVLDDHHIIFADLRSPKTISNLKENPYVAIIGLNMKTRNGWRIWGKMVEIVTLGSIFDDLQSKYAAKGNVNHVVKVLVEKSVVF
jgi:predicted pyridoxine 5'-phosphate oxidase superfamily flavin-nucleotide-binding protein